MTEQFFKDMADGLQPTALTYGWYSRLYFSSQAARQRMPGQSSLSEVYQVNQAHVSTSVCHPKDDIGAISSVEKV